MAQVTDLRHAPYRVKRNTVGLFLSFCSFLNLVSMVALHPPSGFLTCCSSP